MANGSTSSWLSKNCDLIFVTSKVVDIFDSAAPLQIFFSYILYQNIVFHENTRPQQEYKVAGLGKKYTNNLIKLLPDRNLVGKKSDSSNYGGFDISNITSTTLDPSEVVSFEIGVLKRI